mgnify:CR=1 FL=1
MQKAMRKLLAGLMLVLLSLASFAEEQFIVKDGKPNAQIVIAAENRPRMTTLAALELRRGIEKISGARENGGSGARSAGVLADGRRMAHACQVRQAGNKIRIRSK